MLRVYKGPTVRHFSLTAGPMALQIMGHLISQPFRLGWEN